MWWQKPGEFNDKSARHRGIDIHDLAGENEMVPLVAVANGTLKFDNSDAAGWGNTLILRFQKGGKSFLAVYAHLPDSAKAFDGQLVQTGDSLGYAGCSGNAGDGKGNCNTYCVVKGSKRSDVHLHFETIEVATDGNLKQVDPSKLLGFEIATGDDQRLYWCESPPLDSFKTSNPSNRSLNRGTRR
jgi:murein DD-endopeptidase MepM/ murein hydrolase activator NlpD